MRKSSCGVVADRSRLDRQRHSRWIPCAVSDAPYAQGGAHGGTPARPGAGHSSHPPRDRAGTRIALSRQEHPGHHTGRPWRADANSRTGVAVTAVARIGVRRAHASVAAGYIADDHASAATGGGATENVGAADDHRASLAGDALYGPDQDHAGVPGAYRVGPHGAGAGQHAPPRWFPLAVQMARPRSKPWRLHTTSSATPLAHPPPISPLPLFAAGIL